MKISRKGFTLVELLMVIVILGIMAFLVVPTISTGSDYARLKAASRGVVQLSRYAKTMALLHQTPVELVFTSDGKLRVESAATSGVSLVSSDAFAQTNLLEESEEIETPEISEKSSSEDDGGSSYQMADLELEKEYKQISFRFEGYTDTVDDGSGFDNISSVSDSRDEEDEDGEGDDTTSFRIHYKSNGTCRPYRVRVIAGGDELEFKLISVNMLGRAKVEKEGEW